MKKRLQGLLDSAGPPTRTKNWEGGGGKFDTYISLGQRLLLEMNTSSNWLPSWSTVANNNW